MKDNEKRALYESIMNDVAKTVKKHLNEESAGDRHRALISSLFGIKKQIFDAKNNKKFAQAYPRGLFLTEDGIAVDMKVIVDSKGGYKEHKEKVNAWVNSREENGRNVLTSYPEMERVKNTYDTVRVSAENLGELISKVMTMFLWSKCVVVGNVLKFFEFCVEYAFDAEDKKFFINERQKNFVKFNKLTGSELYDAIKKHFDEM